MCLTDKELDLLRTMDKEVTAKGATPGIERTLLELSTKVGWRCVEEAIEKIRAGEPA